MIEAFRNCSLFLKYLRTKTSHFSAAQHSQRRRFQCTFWRTVTTSWCKQTPLWQISGIGLKTSNRFKIILRQRVPKRLSVRVTQRFWSLLKILCTSSLNRRSSIKDCYSICKRKRKVNIMRNQKHCFLLSAISRNILSVSNTCSKLIPGVGSSAIINCASVINAVETSTRRAIPPES